ncbi:unnamed protein product [Darwinula stevensoni]|uniref:Plectin/eS10 N-terminal domain-containing protein n=1 Tax=Darwinula stevensoni TaxID=69355 RepID=A0A7R9A943_9CRUS|nr:unnamed protein product [Darwinula stevensoni]CAG0897009.1 unnamed protein product [Darwinula stevensoni]
MLMPKKNRVAIYEYLFKEGVLVAEKDFYLPKHPHIEVPNLHVIKAMQIVPATLKRATRPESMRPRQPPMRGESGMSKPSEDRSSYRRAALGSPDKKGDVGAGAATNLEFRGGFGRGRGAPPP